MAIMEICCKKGTVTYGMKVHNFQLYSIMPFTAIAHKINSSFSG